MSDVLDLYSWMPASWGISANTGFGEVISSFTAAGLASGVYNGLTTADLSNWGTSYHNTYFDTWSSEFEAFQLGNSDTHVVAIGRNVVPAPGGERLFRS